MNTPAQRVDTDDSRLVVKRWTRYGKDRLYVSTQTGERVGYLDLLTNDTTLERADLDGAFHEAISTHQHKRPGAPESVFSAEPSPSDSPATSPPTAPEPAVEMDWTDLAANRAGQGVRAEADALRADMKARSKMGTLLARALDMKTDERAFRVGADGEEAVGARLEKLIKRGWRVLHSIPVGDRGSDIDHLLIGPMGVYPINTKRHPHGRVWVGEHQIRVNGQPTQYLRNSRYEGDRVRKALLRTTGLEVHVRPALVFLTGTVVPQVTIKQMPADVLVLDRLDIPGYFKRGRERLTTEQVETVYQHARRSTTWH